MRKLWFLLGALQGCLYSMQEHIEITASNNQKIDLSLSAFNRLMKASTILQNAVNDLDYKVPDYLPFIQNPADVVSISNLLNDDGTANEVRCLKKAKGDWCKIAHSLDALGIDCLTSYALESLEKAYSSSPFSQALLNQRASQSLTHETLPPALKNALAERINKKNVSALWGSLSKTLQGHNNGVSSLALTQDGKTLASGSYDTTIKLWNLSTGALLKTLEGHNDLVTSLVITPNGTTLASASYDTTIKLWNLSTGALLKTLQGHNDWVLSLALTQDGKTLASGSRGDTTIKLWDVSRGKVLKTLQGHNNGVSSLALTQDGKTLASGSYDTTIKLWNLSTGALLKTLEGHNDLVTSLVITPNGTTLASASYDTTIKLWNLSSGALLKTLQGHNGVVRSLALTQDGKTLASGSYDTTIKLWDISTGKVLKTLQGHNDWVRSLALTQDGKTLASASDDTTIKLWGISPELKDYLLQAPLEQALVIHALHTTRPTLSQLFTVSGKARAYFHQLPLPLQKLLSEKLNVKKNISSTLGRIYLSLNVIKTPFKFLFHYVLPERFN